MKSEFPLKMVFAVVSIYALVTILFLDGKKRDDTGTPQRMTEKARHMPVPSVPLSW